MEPRPRTRRAVPVASSGRMLTRPHSSARNVGLRTPPRARSRVSLRTGVGARRTPTTRGRIVKSVSVERKGLHYRIDHYSNGRQTWGFLTISQRGKKDAAGKLSPAQLQEWMRHVGQQGGEKKALSSLVGTVASNPEGLNEVLKALLHVI